jgi:hypothetical protein
MPTIRRKIQNGTNTGGRSSGGNVSSPISRASQVPDAIKLPSLGTSSATLRGLIGNGDQPQRYLDYRRLKGTGRFNLGQGIVGTVSGIGAAASATVSGFVAQSFGAAAGFYVMTGVAWIAVVVRWAFMPKTKVANSTSEQGERS